MLLGFRKPDGVNMDLTFSRLPLGLDFQKGAPITIEKVHRESQAETLGVQPEWVLVFCNGEDLSKKSVRDGIQTLRAASKSLPQLRKLVHDERCSATCRSALLDAVEATAVAAAEARLLADAENALSNASGICDLVYKCKCNAGLFNCLLMFLRVAECAESRENAYRSVLFDGTSLPLYGDVSALFPALPGAPGGDSTTAVEFVDRTKEFAGGGSFANCRGVYECRGGLLAGDVVQGRRLAARYISLSLPVEACLLQAAADLDLANAIGVHIRRTDKGKEAPSNISLTVDDVVLAVRKQAAVLGVFLVYLASDDVQFSTDIQGHLEANGLPSVSWGSHMSARPGKASHYDHEIPGLEKAADAVADCFLLSRCKGGISTYSSLSVIAALWAKPDVPWIHFYEQSAPIDGAADPYRRHSPTLTPE